MTYKNRILPAATLAAAALTASCIPAHADLMAFLGNNVTIPDLIHSGTGWAGNHEDQETEPGTIGSQVWDLEAFFQNGSQLTLVGGFDFKNGTVYSGSTYSSGDIFLDIDGDAVFGPPADGSGVGNNNTVNNIFGYDYALQLDMNAMTYAVIDLDTQSVLLKTVSETINQESNPWRYSSGGEILPGYANVPLNYQSGLSDSDVGGLLGGNHYALSVDLSFLGAGNVISHFTMSCGNDNLMGSFVIEPEPPPFRTTPDGGSTALFLLGGLLGLQQIRSRMRA